MGLIETPQRKTTLSIECHDEDCRYAGCHYGDCRGTVTSQKLFIVESR